jgi:hypothetical protein
MLTEIVKKARGLIKSKRRWTQGQIAVSRDGRLVSVYDPAAYKLCAYGALCRASIERGFTPLMAEPIVRKLVSRGQILGAINDGPDGHRKVLALFDKALAEA